MSRKIYTATLILNAFFGALLDYIGNNHLHVHHRYDHHRDDDFHKYHRDYNVDHFSIDYLGC